jgi:type I restriction enzyme S subunit
MTHEKLPAGWARAPLSEVADINPGSFSKPPQDHDLVSFVPMAAVEEGSGRLDASTYRPWVEVKKGYTLFQDDDVLFAKVTPCMENGKAALAARLKGGRGAGSTEFFVLRSRGGVDPKYLMHFVLQSSFRRDARAAMQGVAGLLRVRKEFMQTAQVPVAPLPEQRRIVAEIERQFTRLDAGVEALKRVQAQLKRYRASVLKAACEGRLVPTEAELARHEKRDYEAADKLLARILKERRARWEADQLSKMKAVGKPPKDDKWKAKYAEPATPRPDDLRGATPEGWVRTTIDSVAESLDHLRVPVNKKERAARPGSVPYYGANGQVGWIDTALFNEPLVLVVEDETFTGREKPFSYRIDGPAWVNNHAHVLRASGAVTTAFLNIALSFYPFIPLTTGTTGRKKLTQAALLGAPFDLPPLAEQSRIVEEAERHLSLIVASEQFVERALERSSAIRQAILKAAFDGRLVPQDLRDEPASKLLERISAAVENKPLPKQGRAKQTTAVPKMKATR